MSNSNHFPANRNSGEAPEKSSSNFAQTCNLLSNYLKEKGIRDLNLEINGKLEVTGKAETSTMNLLANMEQSNVSKSADVCPQYATKPSSSAATNKPSSSKSATVEPKTAQMTIFYGGKVIVFDDIPLERAKDLVLFASNGSSPLDTSSTFVPTSTNVAQCKKFPQNVASVDRMDADGGSPLPTSSNFATTVSSDCAKDRSQTRAEAIDSDLPIAGRSSLHRFFQKRKERATARAPYQVHNPPAAPIKNERQFDLNL